MGKTSLNQCFTGHCGEFFCLEHIKYRHKKNLITKLVIRFWRVEDGAPIPTMESLLQVFTDHFNHYFLPYGHI